ncbi:hypothetical protein JVW19_18920, partial [Vibrio cholerae O1]|nr:hypothetical protein [Vibrio cholerae O1]
KDGKPPVTFDKDFKNAIITWADGSQTQVPSWQFLKQKAAPAPEPSVPTPAAEKTFIVEHPETPTVVTFDPFKTTTAEITTGNVATQLNNLKSTLKAKTAKDSQNPQTKVTITDVEYSVDNNGVG